MAKWMAGFTEGFHWVASVPRRFGLAIAEQVEFARIVWSERFDLANSFYIHRDRDDALYATAARFRTVGRSERSGLAVRAFPKTKSERPPGLTAMMHASAWTVRWVRSTHSTSMAMFRLSRSRKKRLANLGWGWGKRV
jgi:hypothetical protein